MLELSTHPIILYKLDITRGIIIKLK